MHRYTENASTLSMAWSVEPLGTTISTRFAMSAMNVDSAVESPMNDAECLQWNWTFTVSGNSDVYTVCEEEELSFDPAEVNCAPDRQDFEID